MSHANEGLSPAWRNRPGRDLLIALGILYLGYASLILAQTGDLLGSLLAPLLFFPLTVPAGVGYSMLIVTWLTPIAVVALIVGFGALVIRMPWFARVPLIVLAAVAAAYVTVQMGVAIR